MNNPHQWLQPTTPPCRPFRPFLIILCGLSGSGKSTVSGFIAETFQAAWVRADVVRKRLSGLSPLQSSHEAGLDIYTLETNKKTFEQMEQLARQLIQESYPVIIDSAALRVSERDRFLSLASQLNTPKWIIQCIAEEKDLEQRIRLRQSQKNEPSEATVETLQHQKKWIEPLTEQQQKWLISVNTSCDQWQQELKNKLTQHLNPQWGPSI